VPSNKKKPPPTGKKARALAVQKILRNVEKKMSAADVKASLGDYIRLFQLSKEMGEEPKTDITVTWIETDPDPTEK
jgi:hypothetical protein